MKVEILDSSVAITGEMGGLKQVLQKEELFHVTHLGKTHFCMQFMIMRNGTCAVMAFLQTVMHSIKSVLLIMDLGTYYGFQVHTCIIANNIIYNIILFYTYYISLSLVLYTYVCMYICDLICKNPTQFRI